MFHPIHIISSTMILFFAVDNAIGETKSKIIINDVFDYYAKDLGDLIKELEVNKTIDVAAIVKKVVFEGATPTFCNGSLFGISNLRRHGNMYLGMQYPVNIQGELLLPEVNGSYKLIEGNSVDCNVSYSYANTVMKFNVTLDPFFSLKSRILMAVRGDLNATRLTVDGCSHSFLTPKLDETIKKKIKYNQENQRKIINKIASEMSEKIAPRVTAILPKLARRAAVEIIENFDIKLNPHFTDDDGKFHLDVYVTKNSD